MTKTKFTSALLAIVLALSLSSCYTLNHTVGKGAQGGSEQEHRVWFALWGLIPLGDYDSQELAGGASNYSIETQWTPIDILFNLVTAWVTVYSRTVKVTQ